MKKGQESLQFDDGTIDRAESLHPEAGALQLSSATLTVDDIETRVRAMSRLELANIWQRRWKRAVPEGLSRRLLEYNAAWQIQYEQHGGWSAATRRRLAALIKQDGDKSTDAKERQVGALASGPSRHRALRPGIRLVRQWGGQSHIVEVVAGGFTWQGKHFRSLTAIARAITGAHWSGPRFFGLRSTGEPVRQRKARRGSSPCGDDLASQAREHPDA